MILNVEPSKKKFEEHTVVENPYQDLLDFSKAFEDQLFAIKINQSTNIYEQAKKKVLENDRSFLFKNR